MSKLTIVNSTIEDIDFIFQLFDQAIRYQKVNRYDLWPVFDRALIEKEISEHRHWKILENDLILCVFSIQYNDPIIWGEKDSEPSVYIHRIAVNPVAKGRRLVCLIKEWAIVHAKVHGKKFVRMDTWGRNEQLRKYYVDCGFHYIGQQHLTKTDGLPDHYGGDELSLFELEV